LERFSLILEHPLFVEKLERINELERERLFCGHGMEHLLDVARIAYILYLESRPEQASGAPISSSEFSKEMFYAAAFLHDIGRARQYEDGTPHEQESARLAEMILPECGFDASESELMLDAILAHRTKIGKGRTGFVGFLYRADKLSRRCCDCAVADECDWELKNIRLEY